MRKTAALERKTTAQIPVPKSSEVFTVKGQTYVILRFDKSRGPNLEQTMAIAKSIKGSEMLTVEESRKIKDDAESNGAFKQALKPGEWGYIRDLESEARGEAACLNHRMDFWGLFVGREVVPDYAAPVMILKVAASEAAVPQSTAAELRK